MNTETLGFGIVGTGFIAGVMADALASSSNTRLAAVSSRRQETADDFVKDRAPAVACEGIDALLSQNDVDAVYVACPTAAKEAIALAAIAAGKHVLVDKPFMDQESLKRMTDAAQNQGVLFMDATHFTHHPRTAAIKNTTPEKIGSPKSLHTSFYFPFAERENIRFDPAQEPTGALGDMAWYSMRAVVEYLQPTGTLESVSAVAERDDETGAITRATGLVAFSSGETATFDVGYTAGTILMDFSLQGTSGVIAMDDFVLDWNKSFAFQNPDTSTGYTFRQGMDTRKDFAWIETPSDTGAHVLMLDRFAAIAVEGLPNNAAMRCAQSSLETQGLLDAIRALL